MGTIDPTRGPNGTVYVASDLASLGELALRNQQGTYVHELGNLLDARLNPKGKNGRNPGYVYGDDESEFDKDTGQQLEDCVFREGKWFPR